VKILVQVNVGEEPQKGGVHPAELKGLLESLTALSNLEVRGLMCIPPAGGDGEASRPWFKRLRELRDAAGLEHCSMGNERRLRGRHRGRGNHGAGGDGDLRTPGASGRHHGGRGVSIKGKRVAFLGGGNMGEALIKGLAQAGLVPAGSISASDPRADHLAQVAHRYGIRAVADNSALVSEADVIIPRREAPDHGCRAQADRLRGGRRQAPHLHRGWCLHAQAP
jgi:hypothetical protein